MAHKAADSGYLITVGKVSMGYNDGSLTALIHCDSPTGNLNANVQVFSRILRRFPGGSDERKAYIRVSTQDSKNYNAQYYMLLKLKAMLDDKTVFSKFDGRNLKIQFF